MFNFLERTMNTFGLLNNSVSIFEIPSGYNMRQCNFQTSEEPLITSMKHLKNLYSNVSPDWRLFEGNYPTLAFLAYLNSVRNWEAGKRRHTSFS